MSDASSGAASAVLSGDNSAAGATGAAGGQGQQGGATGASGATGAAANDKWYSGAPPELQGLVEKKGWKDLSDSLKSYAELEKQFHGDKLPLPKDENDADGWGKVYTKLGRPETPEGYKAPEGADEATVKALAPELHKLGISQKQFENLAKLDIQRNQQAVTAENTRFLADQDAAMNKLQTEWGAKFNENIEVNRRAMRNLGISVDDANRMMQSGGTEKFMRLLNLAGAAAREDNAGGLGEAQLGFGMTPNRAKAELAAKKGELLKRAHSGDKSASAELDRLYRIAEGYAGA
jgi:hypothetical protein